MSSKIDLLNQPDTWRNAFPMNEAERAVRFLFETWQDIIVPTKRAYFKPTKRENQHTEQFWIYLDKLSTSHGRLTGQWSYEVPKAIIEDDEADEPAIEKRIRKDITYFSNANPIRLFIIFEFKKLRATDNRSLSDYKGTDGMRRFVDGYYAIGLPMALMVGMVIGDKAACVDKLQRSILSPKDLSDLCMIDDKTGNYIIAPSFLFPGVATFDTEHKRPASKNRVHNTIILSHLFVELPSEDND